MDYIQKELARLVDILPDCKSLELGQAAHGRFKKAIKVATNFIRPQLQKLMDNSKNITNYKIAMRRKADFTAIADWIEEIFDPQQGYKRAHTWTRGTSKAPPYPQLCGEKVSTIVILTKLEVYCCKSGEHYGPRLRVVNVSNICGYICKSLYQK